MGDGTFWEMVTSFLEGVIELRTVKDMGDGGVKNPGKSGDVLYERPLSVAPIMPKTIESFSFHPNWPLVKSFIQFFSTSLRKLTANDKNSEPFSYYRKN